MNYSPDGFVIIKRRETYFVLTGFDLPTEEQWRVNSGIASVSQAGEWYLIGGVSGSIYALLPEREDKLNDYARLILVTILASDEEAEQIPFTQFLEEFGHED